MNYRIQSGLLVAAILLFCAQNVPAGVVCYQYEYAPNLVRTVQKLLKTQGLYHGPINGKFGPKTKLAIQSFQEKHGITFPFNYALKESNSGQLEERTLRAMFGDDAPTGVTVIRNPHHAPDKWWTETCE
jgi:hypothetical protein